MVQYGESLIVPPPGEPVTLDEAKTWCRVDLEFDADDDLLRDLITSAREHCESATGRAFITQTWRIALDAFPCGGGLILPRPKLQSVQQVQYCDPDGVLQTLDPSLYEVDTFREPGWLLPALGFGGSAGWPATRRQSNAVLIDVVCGYGSSEQVPSGLKTAIKLLVAHWYAHRGEIGQPLNAADGLLMQFWTGTQ